MTCEKVQERLSAHLDRALGWLARRHVEAHLSACAVCRRERDALARTIALVREHAREEVPRDVTAAVMARISAQRVRPARGPLARPAILVPAALAMVIAVSLQVSNREPAPPSAQAVLPAAYVREYAGFQASQEVGGGNGVFLVVSEFPGEMQ
ncbi:MAG: zf-HC2 domain-containing protein [Armatimonadetes bacterium]|nr:zf-HC2 domain-containing protein [Armatimonadota bacterium]